MINKEIIEQIKSKLSPEEYNEKNNEFLEDAKKLNIPLEQQENYCIRRWAIYFSKAIYSLSNAKKVNTQAVILGLTSTDYGARRAYDKAIQEYTNNPAKAIEEGLTNNTGEPIHQKGFKKGKKIDLNELTYVAQGFFKLEDSQKFVKGIINLGNNPSIPLNKLISFTASTAQEIPEMANLRKNRLTSFQIIQDLKHKDIIELLNNHSKILNINEAIEIAKQRKNLRDAGEQTNFNDFYIINGDMGSEGINILDDGRISDVMTLIEVLNPEKFSESMFDGAMPSMTVWIDKKLSHIPRNIDSNAMNILVVGVPSMSYDQNNEERYSVNTTGIIIEEQYLIQQDAEPVTMDNQEFI